MSVRIGAPDFRKMYNQYQAKYVIPNKVFMDGHIAGVRVPDILVHSIHA